MRSIRQYLVLLLLLVSLVVSGVAVAAQATPEATAETVTIIGGAESPVIVSVADLQALPNETVDVTYTASGDPQDHSFTGTPLLGVLESEGLPWDEDARNPWLGHIVLVTATDGYQVVFGGGELDPAFGNVAIYLAWEQDGAPLSAEVRPHQSPVRSRSERPCIPWLVVRSLLGCGPASIRPAEDTSGPIWTGT